MNFNSDDINIGSAIITYRFPAGSSLPKVSEKLQEGNYTMYVIESNTETNTIKVSVSPISSDYDPIIPFMEKLDEVKDSIAKYIYEETSGPMLNFVGWDNLTKDSKEQYINTTKEIIEFLNTKGLLSIKY